MATATEPAAKTAPPRNRLIGPMPRIGIRPAIDGRRKGVRESLETQTLEMARSVADLRMICFFSELISSISGRSSRRGAE